MPTVLRGSHGMALETGPCPPHPLLVAHLLGCQPSHVGSPSSQSCPCMWKTQCIQPATSVYMHLLDLFLKHIAAVKALALHTYPLHGEAPPPSWHLIFFLVQLICIFLLHQGLRSRVFLFHSHLLAQIQFRLRLLHNERNNCKPHTCNAMPVHCVSNHSQLSKWNTVAFAGWLLLHNTQRYTLPTCPPSWTPSLVL